MIEDITERKRAERAREEFLNTAAHELRTPLTTLKGYVGMLLMRGGHDELERRLFGALDAQTDRLAQLAQSLVDVSQIQSGGLVLRRTAANLCDLVAEAVRAVQQVAPRHQLSVLCPEPLLAEVDRDKIKVVLVHLLDNAVKYSPRGGPVEVFVDRQGDEAVVSVRDHGIGIPKEKQGQLFQAFYQASPMVRPTTGMGLGLFISRGIVRLHRGRIWFESEDGKGSTFSFSLPMV